jgi:hypothetical protein
MYMLSVIFLELPKTGILPHGSVCLTFPSPVLVYSHLLVFPGSVFEAISDYSVVYPEIRLFSSLYLYQTPL